MHLSAVIGFIRRNPELVACLRRVILEDDQVGRRMLDSIVPLSRTLNRRPQANHRLRSEEGLARWDAAIEDLYLRENLLPPARTEAPQSIGRPAVTTQAGAREHFNWKSFSEAF